MKGFICFDLKLEAVVLSAKDVLSLSSDKLTLVLLIRGRFTSIVLELMLVTPQYNHRKLHSFETDVIFHLPNPSYCLFV